MTTRAEAGIVEEDFELQPQDEAISDGSWEIPEEDREPGPDFNTKVAGMSEEEQSMDMTPVIVGPPAYGSPDPETSAGRLLPLDQHPFNPEALPEDHPARIDPGYGQGYLADLTPGEIGTQFPGAPQRSDLEVAQQGTGEEAGAADYDAMTKADLQAEADARGVEIPSGATKADIVAALEANDAEATA